MTVPPDCYRGQRCSIDFSCSLQKPMLIFPLWRDETPANFTPDVMQSAIISPIALLTDTNVNICFQHLLVNFTRLLSLVHSIQLINTHLQESSFSFFLIPACKSSGRVHHQESFRSQQHKVICKLLLTVVCGSPFLF